VSGPAGRVLTAEESGLTFAPIGRRPAAFESWEKWVVIVGCPCCGTRYRHQTAQAELSRQARCSRCDHLFPLAGARRSYVLLPSRRPAGHFPGDGGLKIGMDDPRLAEQLASNALNAAAQQPTVMSYTAMAEDAVAPPPEVSADRGAASVSEPAQPRARLKPLRGLLVAMLLASIGTAAGYFGALEQQLDPLRWAPVGAMVGLLFGWAWVRWTARRR
jgi:hypothetical protein